MFSEQLTKFPVRSKSPNYRLSQEINSSHNSDLHFEICTAFLKKTGQKLILKQAEMIVDSSKVLTNLEQSFRTSRKQQFYMSTDESDQTPEDSYSYDSEQKVLTRKSIKRRSDTTIQQALKEVQDTCSMSTFGVLSNVISQLNKLQARIQNVEAKQHVMIKKQEAADKYHQENIMLRNKLQAEQSKLQKLEQQLNTLKTKNQNISKCVQEKVNAIAMNQKIVDINQKVYRDIKSFLQDKQMHINSRLRKIQHIEESIMIRIENILNDQNQPETIQSSPEIGASVSCQKCCLMLKKLKESIMKYRNYLEHEAEEVDKLYNKHKKALFTFSSKGSASNKSLG